MSFALRFSRLVRLPSSSSTSRPLRLVVAHRTLKTGSTLPQQDVSYLTLPQLTEKLNSTALSPNDIHTYYPALATKLRERKGKSNSHPPLTEIQVISMLDSLATSASPSDLQRLEEILGDLSTLFQLRPTLDMHTVIIQRLVEHGNARTVLNWLHSMPTRPGNFLPTLEQVHIFLKACTEMESFKFTRHVVNTMQKLGCKPTAETFAILIHARWENALTKDELLPVTAFEPIIEDIKKAGLSYEPEIANLLYDCYASVGEEVHAEKLRSMYEAVFSESLREHTDAQEWLSNLSKMAQRRGIEPTIQLFRKLNKGDSFSEPAATAMLRHAQLLDDLLVIEKELGIKCNASHWARLINNNVRNGHVRQALELYRRSKEAGITPNTALVRPLITGLCQSSSFTPPSETLLDNALEIYRDLSPASSKATESFDGQSSQVADAHIYHTILRALSSSSNHDKYYPIAMSLIEDMKSREISITDSFVATCIICLLMRRASTPQEALEAYRQYSSALDERGYTHVLNAFTKIPFDEENTIPLSEYFTIVKDMRQAGFPITVEAYTILLRHLASVGTQLRRVKDDEGFVIALEKLVTATRRTHDLLTLDASITPDATLLNQLMDTYQRLGCFADAYRVWDLLYISGRYDQISVTIILDACAYAGTLQIATQIHQKLIRDKFVMDLHNWNTWLECLCRLGRLNEALRTACMDMGKLPDVPTPDKESVRILLKFARSLGKKDVVMARLEQYLPELWKSLPQDVLRK